MPQSIIVVVCVYTLEGDGGGLRCGEGESEMDDNEQRHSLTRSVSNIVQQHPGGSSYMDYQRQLLELINN